MIEENGHVSDLALEGRDPFRRVPQTRLVDLWLVLIRFGILQRLIRNDLYP